jgi:hypothetical protein
MPSYILQLSEVMMGPGGFYAFTGVEASEGPVFSVTSVHPTLR